MIWSVLNFDELSEHETDFNNIKLKDVLTEGGCMMYIPILNTILLLIIGVNNVLIKFKEHKDRLK